MKTYKVKFMTVYLGSSLYLLLPIKNDNHFCPEPCILGRNILNYNRLGLNDDLSIKLS